MLTRVTEARSRVGHRSRSTPELVDDPEAFQHFQPAQGELTSALSRLLVVAENYPQLKSDANFRDLQAQLEGTENRIAVARNRYIKARRSSTTSRCGSSRPTSPPWCSATSPSRNFTVENERRSPAPPKVDFGQKQK